MSVAASRGLQARYSFYDVGSENARSVGGLNDVSRGTRLDERTRRPRSASCRRSSADRVNEARAQWTRSHLASPVNDLIGPAVNISGVASFGTSTSSPTGRDLDVFQVADT